MRVVLIPVPILDYAGDKLVPIAQDETKNCPPYGMYLLAGVLRELGYDVTFIDLIARGSNSVACDATIFQSASLVGIGATSMSWATAVDVIKQIRKIAPDLPVVVGGIHPTLFDNYILSTYSVRFVIRGEGETALPALCSALRGEIDLADVPNLSWKDSGGKIIRNKSGLKISESALSNAPLPAYDLLPRGIYKGIAIESSRGCAFDCSFCSTSYRKSYRGLLPEKFVDRLVTISPFVKYTVYKTTHIIDDEFSLNPKRAIAIVHELRKRNLRFGLVYDSRANDLLYPGYVDAIAEYTHQFLIGAECGYDEGLEKIGKGTTCAKLESAARTLMEHGIADRADFSFILGLPWEGIEEVRKTISFAVYLYSEYGVRILLQWYCQIPGSRLWESARKIGRVTEAMYDDYGFFRNLYLWSTTTTLSPKELWSIVDMIQQLQWLSGMDSAGRRRMVEHCVPYALARYFPKDIVQDAEVGLSGLANLREVSRGGSKVKVPQRTVYPLEV